MIVECTECNKKLERNNSQIKASKTGSFFCNRKCRNAWDSKKFQSKKSLYTCPICGDEQYLQKSKANKKKYCSLDCSAKAKSIENTKNISCDYCKTSFNKKKSLVKNRNFCSRKCCQDWNSKFNNNTTIATCEICGKDFNIKAERIGKAKSCSRECHAKRLSAKLSNPDIAERYVQLGIKSSLSQKHQDTKPERMVEDYLVSNKIKYSKQLLMYDKFIVDFYLLDKDIVLEVNGDYWHANPEIYNESKPPNSTQIRQINKDKSRKAYIEKCGHKFRVVWEKDIYRDVDMAVKNILI